MRIRTQFLVGAAILAALLVLIAGFLLYTGVRVDHLEEQRDMAVSLERRASDLMYLSNHYLLYQERQQVSRWESAVASLTSELRRLTVTEQAEVALVARIDQNIERLGNVFHDVESSAHQATAGQLPNYDPSFLQVSWGRLEIQNSQVAADAARLHQLLAADVAQAHRTSTLVTLLGMAAFALLLVGGYFLMYRRTSGGLSVLQTGTEIVGQGDLDFQIPETRGDEIGELSRAFNRMTTDLKGVTTSKHDLEKEIAERRLVEAALTMQQEKLALQNAELEQARDESARLLDQQRHLFSRLQEALLDIPEELPGVRFGHLYLSATEEAKIGGDFYDVFEAKNGQLGLLIGDVSGHGIDAARIATLTKDTIRAFSHQFARPHLVLRETNRLLVERRLSGFVTAFLGFLDPEAGIITHSSAGHLPPIVARNGSVTALESFGPALAAFPDSRYRDTESRLEPGSVVLLYTDGITEARDALGFFGEQGLIDAVRGMGDRPVEDLPAILLKQVQAFSGGPLADDVALLAVHYQGPPNGDAGLS